MSKSKIDLPFDDDQLCPHCKQPMPQQQELVPKVNPIREALGLFAMKFRQRFNEAAPIQPGKDGKLMKQVITTYGVERLASLMDAFFDSHDRFITDSTYSVGVFVSQIGRLIAAENQVARPFGGTQRTSGNVTVAERFVNRRQQR